MTHYHPWVLHKAFAASHAWRITLIYFAVSPAM
jgi:hypothetical protein